MSKKNSFILVLLLCVGLIFPGFFYPRASRETFDFSSVMLRVKILNNWRTITRSNPTRIRLKPRNTKDIFVKIKKVTLSARQSNYLRQQKPRKFSIKAQNGFIRRFSKYNPVFKKAKIYEISTYSAILMKFDLERGIGQSVYFTDNNNYFRADAICYRESYSEYTSAFRRIFKSLRIVLKTSFNGGGNGADEGFSVRETSDGGYVILGSTTPTGKTTPDGWLIKTDSDRNEEWNKTFGGTDNNWDDGAYDVQQTLDGGYIITGYARTETSGSSGDLWLIKTDSSGNKEWDQTFSGSGNESYGDLGNSVQQTSDGGYIIAGFTKSPGGDNYDVWLVKTGSDGTEEWNQTFDGSDNDEDKGYSVQQTSDGGYIIAGITTSSSSGLDVWLIKTDSGGNKEWDQAFDGSGSIEDQGKSVQQTSDGGYIITGFTNENHSGGSDLWLIKTNSAGNREWDQAFNGSYGSGDYGYSVRQTTDGGYIITGTSMTSSGYYDAWLIKTDSDGTEEWNNTFDGGEDGSGWDNSDHAYSVRQTSDGRYIITGTVYSSSSGKDVWLIKTDSQGECI